MGTRSIGCLLLWCGLWGAVPAVADEPAPLRVQVDDPRAFGHLVGDVVTRTIVLDVPRRLQLREDSLPNVGRVGQALELREVEHARGWTLAGTRHTLRLHYQVFHAPREPRVLDLPSFTLRFDGTPRPEEWRVDFAPLGVTPLAHDPPPMRNGFGMLRPDRPIQRVDTRPEQTRLRVYALLALLPLTHLAVVYLGAPWWRRRQRPFALARRRVQALALDAAPPAWLEAWRALHAALDASAGEVLHAAALDRYLARWPRFVPLRAELVSFFERSQALFFRGETPSEADRRWLQDFSQRCFDVERGAA